MRTENESATDRSNDPTVLFMETEENVHAAKIALFAEWMEDDHVLVHLDARHEGVHVPQHLSGSPNLALKLSYKFQGEVKHDDEVITAFLKFKGEYFQCIIPWSAVWGISSSEGESRVWISELPKELAHLADTLGAGTVTASTKPGKTDGKKRKPSLSVVDKGDRKPPVLKRVK